MSKPSQAQTDASRANGRHGRGPNTARGKNRSSQNSLRHGLAGRIVVLPTEDMEVYTRFSKELVDSLKPESPMECQFAQTVADTQWRLNRARTYEDGMLALGHFEAADDFSAESPRMQSALTAAKVFREHSKDFVNLSLYEQRISRAQKEALRQFRELQAERKAAAPPVIEPLEITRAPARTVAAAATSVAEVTSSAVAQEDPGFVYARVNLVDYDPGAFDPSFYKNEIPVEVPLWFREAEAAERAERGAA